MSKEKDTQQIFSHLDFHANHLALQEREEEQKMIASSGEKLLESSENVNLDGSLGKMLKALLTSKKAWSSDRCEMTWKKKVSKSNVLLFQLQASVRGIKGKECGFLPTPNTMDHIDRKGMRPSRAATNRKSGYLSEMIKMYPTPTRGMWKQDVNDNGEYAKRVKEKGHQVMLPAFVKLYPTPNARDWKDSINKVPPSVGKTRGHSLGQRIAADQEKRMYPTPTQRDWKDTTVSKSYQNRNSDSLPIKMMKEGKPGGRLNPNFVEFLLAYPMNWTKIEPTE